MVCTISSVFHESVLYIIHESVFIGFEICAIALGLKGSRLHSCYPTKVTRCPIKGTADQPLVTSPCPAFFASPPCQWILVSLRMSTVFLPIKVSFTVAHCNTVLLV